MTNTPSYRSYEQRIRKIAQRTVHRSSRVLINTTTGRLYDKAEQPAAFEVLSIFNETVSPMTTHTHRSHVKHEVRQYFRYIMLSHMRGDNEPLFQQMVRRTVYNLDQLLACDKLQTFCQIVRDIGLSYQ